MIIRANDKEVIVKSILGDSMKRGLRDYPALRFEFENEITASDIETLISGSFEILDDEGNVQGKYDGYNTVKNLSISIGRITSEEQELIDLETEMSELRIENDEYQTAITHLERENAELLFNSMTGEDFNEISNESTEA